jgi:hypothetical protein
MGIWDDLIRMEEYMIEGVQWGTRASGKTALRGDVGIYCGMGNELMRRRDRYCF